MKENKKIFNKKTDFDMIASEGHVLQAKMHAHTSRKNQLMPLAIAAFMASAAVLVGLQYSPIFKSYEHKSVRVETGGLFFNPQEMTKLPGDIKTHVRYKKFEALPTSQKKGISAADYRNLLVEYNKNSVDYARFHYDETDTSNWNYLQHNLLNNMPPPYAANAAIGGLKSDKNIALMEEKGMVLLSQKSVFFVGFVDNQLSISSQKDGKCYYYFGVPLADDCVQVFAENDRQALDELSALYVEMPELANWFLSGNQKFAGINTTEDEYFNFVTSVSAAAKSDGNFFNSKTFKIYSTLPNSERPIFLKNSGVFHSTEILQPKPFATEINGGYLVGGYLNNQLNLVLIENGSGYCTLMYGSFANTICQAGNITKHLSAIKPAFMKSEEIGSLLVESPLNSQMIALPASKDKNYGIYLPSYKRLLDVLKNEVFSNGYDLKKWETLEDFETKAIFVRPEQISQNLNNLENGLLIIPKDSQKMFIAAYSHGEFNLQVIDMKKYERSDCRDIIGDICRHPVDRLADYTDIIKYFNN